jgi:hypothetical protein
MPVLGEYAPALRDELPDRRCQDLHKLRLAFPITHNVSLPFLREKADITSANGASRRAERIIRRGLLSKWGRVVNDAPPLSRTRAPMI